MQLRIRVSHKTIADATDCDEVVGAGRVVLDVAAEANDEVVDGAGVGIFVDTPDSFEDVFAGDDLAFVIGEVAEEIGLHDCQVGSAVGGDELEGVEADGAVVKGVGGRLVAARGFRFGFGGGALPGCATEEGFDAYEEDIEVEGLGEVVVGPGFNAFEDVFGAGASGEEQNGSVDAGFTEGADDGEAVGTREHAVEDYGGGWLGWGEEPDECSVAVGFVVSAVALGLEVEEEALSEVFFVFDDGDERLGGVNVHDLGAKLTCYRGGFENGSEQY
jgi:hypothetical protein